MSADKSNRISDDSGVVCFNTMEDHHQAFTDSSSNSSSSAMFLTAERHQKSSDNASPSSLLQYKSVYSNSSSLHSSIITTTVPVKRREKRGNYVIGSGQVQVAGENSVHEDNVPTTNKYGVKRLSHVQQMRLRFENWCSINNEVKRCEASHCKGIKEEQFDSLPIIPFAKGGGDKRPLLVESPWVEEEEVTKVLGGRGDKHKPAVQESPPNPPESPLVCECSDNEGGVEANGNQGEQEEEEGSFRENGSVPIAGLKGEYEPLEVQEDSRFSDFEEEHDDIHSHEPIIYEVKNADLCDTIEEDDFQEVLLENIEDDDLVTESTATNTLPDLLNKTFTNLLNIVDELISCERTYISSLEAGVKNYKVVFRDPEIIKTLPEGLRGQDGVIFGNIDRICDFHRDELLPKLLDCDRNVTKICEVFCEFIQKDYFYKYVLYAMNRTKSEHVCSRNTEFFKRRQEQIGDRLGLNSFLVKPIQRLPHYKMLFNQMIVELLKNMRDESLKPLIGICCKTEKYVQKLLDTVNESMHINDIEDCYEFNILHQGKFRKMDFFDVYEKYSNYRYKGRLFLFDKSLVYTEQTSKNRLIYKGHYMRTKIGMEPDRTTTSSHVQSKPKLILFSEKLNQQCIEVSSENPVVYEWKSMIDDIIRSFIVEERERVKKGKRPRAVTMRAITPELRSTTRGSIYSVKSLASDISSLSSSSGGSDRSSKISVDSRLGALAGEAEKLSRRTTWEDRKYVEKLLNAEKHFLRMFIDNKKFYVDDLPEHVQESLAFYTQRFEDIYWFHNQLHEEINGCGFNVEKVCELFKTHLKLGNFEVYIKYAVTLGKAEALIGKSKDTVSSNFYSDRVSLKHFLHLPMKNISDYLSTFNEILDDSFSNGGTMTNLFKYCAIIEVDFNQLQRRCMENYRLYALKDEKIHYKIHGQVEHSDVVSFNALNVLNYKLLLTKSTLICVNIRSNSYKEKFLGIFFIIPLKHLTMKESKVKPNRLKFASAETRLMHRVIFAKQEKKESFQRFVVQYQRKIFRLD